MNNDILSQHAQNGEPLSGRPSPGGIFLKTPVVPLMKNHLVSLSKGLVLGLSLAVAGGLLFDLQSARAATDTWSATPTTGAWGTAANWSDAGNTVPANGDSLEFGTSTITTSTDNLMTPATYTLGGITFDVGSSAYTITTGTASTNGFTLAGNVTNNGTHLETINDLIALSGTDTFTTSTGGGNITIGGVISGGGLTVAGSGLLTLSAPNTYSGGTTISSGTATITNAAGFGTGSVAVGSSGVAVLNAGSVTIANNFTGSGTIIADLPTGANTLTLSGTYSGFTGTLNISSGGKLQFNNATQGNVISSSATIDILSGGTIYEANGLTYGANLILNGGATGEALGQLRLEGNSVWSGNITLDASTTIGANSTTGFISGNIGQNGGTFGITKLGAGTTVLTGSSSYAGVTTISAGILQLGNGGATGSLSATGAITDNATLTINRNNPVNQGVDFGAIGGTGAFVQAGSGTTTLSGANTYTGTTTVSAGTLIYSGSLASGAQISVGVAGGGSAVMDILPGSSVKLSPNGTNNIEIGSGITISTGQGFLYQSGGSLIGSTGGTSPYTALTIGAGASGNSYGYYNLSGGTAAVSELDAGGFHGAATGVVDMSGGTMNVNTWLIVDRSGDSGGIGILNLTGGTMTFTGPAGQFANNWGTNGTAVINIGNATLSATNANINLNYGSNGSNGSATNFGEINLLTGGTLQANSITSSAAGTRLVNFNGGLLKASAATTTFLNTNLSGVNVFSGGGTIDNNGVAITIPVGLLAASGSGVSSIAVTNAGAGYLGAPAVTFTGGGGTGAAGYAVINSGTISQIVITNPGTGYTSAPTIVFTGGGATTGAIATSGVALNTSGGMTFQGTGTTTLSGNNTYGGGTMISGGILEFSTTNAMPSSGTVATGSGATLAVNVGGANQFTTATSGVGSIGGLLSGIGGQGAPVTWSSGAALGIDTAAASGTYGGVISNPGGNVLGLTKLGANTLTLTGPNTFTGGVTLSAGTLNAGSAQTASSGALGALTAGSSIVFKGGTLQYSAASNNFDYSPYFSTTASTGAISIDTNGQLVSFGTALTNSNAPQGLTLNDTNATKGTLTLTVANSYSGATTVTAGTLSITGGNSGGGTYSVGSGATLTIGGGTVTASTVTLTAGTGTTLNLNGGILLVGTSVSVATLNTNTALDFNGGTLESSAAITVSTNLPINILSGGATIDSTGGNITFSSGLAYAASSGNITIQGGHTVTVSDNSANETGNFTVTGSGTKWTLNGASGTTSAGSLTINANATVDMAAQTFTTGGLAGAGTLTDSSTSKVFSITGSGSNTFSGAITGAVALTVSMSGGGTQTLSGANTYTGVTTLTTGMLTLVANGTNTSGGITSALSNASTELLLGAGTTLALQGNTTNTIFEPSNTYGTGIGAGQVAGVNGSASTTTGIYESGNGTYNFSAGGSGAAGTTLILGNFGQLGPGNTTPTFNFAANNNYTLQIGSGPSGTGALYVFNNTAINSTVAGGTLSIPGGILINYANTYTQTFGGPGNISVGVLSNPTGTMNVIYNGTGTLTLSGANTYGGTTTVSAGTLSLTGGLTGSNITTSGAGIVSESSAGVIAGSGATFTQGSSGTSILAGANTYGGTTTINSGTLQVGNGTSGSLNAGDVLTFGGTGTFNYQGVTTGSTLTLGALTFGAGDGTVQSTYGGTSGNTQLTFASLAARTAGATGNFVPSGGSNGTTNLITFTTGPTVANGILGQAYFFNGSSYATYSGGYVQAELSNDGFYVANSGGPNSIANGSTTNVVLSGNATAQASASIYTLNIGARTLSLAGGAAFQTNGILESGGGSSTIVSGGASLSTSTSGGELVIRINLAGDSSTISTPIVDNATSALTKSGLGTLTLQGMNTYAGNTYVAAGTLAISGNGDLGTSGSTSGSYAGNIGDFGTFTYGSSTNQTLSGVISGAGGLIENASGTLTLSGANTFSGGLTIVAGAVAAATNTAFGGSGGTAGAITINGGTLDTTAVSAALTNTHAITIGASGGTINVLGTLISGVVNGANSRVIFGTAGDLIGTAALTISGTGALDPFGASGVVVLNAANTGYTGNVTLQNGGLVEISNASAIGAGGTYTLGNNSGLNVDNSYTESNAITVSGANAVLSFANGTTGVFGGSVTLTNSVTVGLRDWYNLQTVRSGAISGAITGAGGLTVNSGGNSGGTLTLGNAAAGDTYFGATVLSNGSVTVSSGGAIANSASYSAINGTLTLTYAAATNNAMLNSSGNVSLGYGAGLTLTGVNGTALNQNIGTLALTGGANTITVTPTGTAIAALTANAFSRTSNATSLVLGASLGQSSSNTTAAEVILNSTSGLAQVGSNTLSGAGTSDATKGLTIIPYFFGGASGNGTDFLTYDTTYGLRLLTTAEQTTLNAGYTTAATPDNAIGFNGTISTTSGVTLNSLLFSTASQTLNGSGGSLTVNSGAIAATAASEVIGNGFSGLTLGNGTWNEGVITTVSGDTLTINTPISVTGGGGLTVTGAGTLALGAVNTYTGQTTINQGTLSASVNNVFNGTTSPAALWVNNGGTAAFGATTQTVSGLTLAGAATVSGASGTLSLGTGGITYLSADGISSGGSTISVTTLNLNGTQTINVAATPNDWNPLFNANSGYKELTISSAVVNGSGTGGITKNGAGVLELSGAGASNTYSGPTTVNGGVLYLLNAAAGVPNSAITVNNGATLAAQLATQNINDTIGASLTMNGGNAIFGTSDNPNSAAGRNLHYNFTNALTLASGANLVALNSTQNGGFGSVVDFASLSRTAGAGATVLFRGHNLGAGTQGSNAGNDGIDFTAAPALVGGGGAIGTTTTSIIPYAIGDQGNYQSSFYLSAGLGTDFVTLGNSNSPQLLTTYATSITSGAVVLNNVKITDASATGINAATTVNSLILNSALASLGSAGTSAVDGTGTLTINSGAVMVTTTSAANGNGGSNGNFGGLFQNNATIGAGGLTLAFGAKEAIVTVAGSSTLTMASTSGGITGTGGLTKSGAGTLYLNAADAISGNTIIDAGSIILGNSLALQNSTLYYNNQGGAFSFGTLTSATFGGLGSTSGSGSPAGENIALTNGSLANVALTVGNDNLAGDTYSGVLSGGGSLTKVGTGTQTLTGANTYTGAVTVNSGTLAVNSLAAVGAAQPLGENSTVTLAGASSGAPGTLQYTGGTGTLQQGVTVTTGDYGTISNTGGGVLTLPAISKNGSVLNLRGGKFVAAGAISGANSGSDLNVIGGATVGETVANSYNGPTSISGGGTLLTGVAGALPTGTPSALTLGAATDGSVTNTLDLLGTSQTVSSLTSISNGGSSNLNQIISSNGSASSPASGLVASSATGTLTVNYNGGTTDTFSGSIGDSSSNNRNNIALTKTGTGKLILAGNNYYTGVTNVNQGTLVLGAAEAIDYSSGVNLAGGTLAAAGNNQSGLQTLTLSANSNLDFNQPGSGNATSTQIGFTNIGAYTSNVFLTVYNWDGTAGSSASNSDYLFIGTSALTTPELSEIQFNIGGTDYGAAQVNFGGSEEIYASSTVVPEPSTVFAALALLGLVGYRERRRVSILVRTLIKTA